MSEIVIVTTAQTGPSGGGGGGSAATDITFAPTGSIVATNVQTAIAEVATDAAAAYQPLDSDLTAIAALSTTAYGRAFLTLANQATTMALLSASSDTASGIVELATTAETTTGTDTVRAVTPAGLSNATTASNINARIGVEKAGTLIGTRRRINFIDGANVTVTVADDAANEEVDVTIAASGGGGSVATDTIFDAKGDLPVGTGADTAAKLTVGSNGQRLVAYSTASQGVAWAGTGHPRFGSTNRGLPTRLSTVVGVTTVGYTANRAYYFPFQIDAPITISEAHAEVTVTGAGAMDLWIYNMSESAGDVYPSTLAADLGNVSVSSTGVKTISSLSVTLPPGLYAAVWISDVAPTLRTTLNTFLDSAMVANSGSANLFNDIVWAYTTLTYTTTAPGSFPAGPPTYGPSASGAPRWYQPIWFTWS